MGQADCKLVRGAINKNVFYNIASYWPSFYSICLALLQGLTDGHYQLICRIYPNSEKSYFERAKQCDDGRTETLGHIESLSVFQCAIHVNYFCNIDDNKY